MSERLSETVTCDEDESARYFAAVREYYAEQVLGNAGCRCEHLDVCTKSAAPNTFAAGQLSFVGPNYAMRWNGRPWQIAIVSMQTGELEAPMTMERRLEQYAQRVREDFSKRNGHIRGTSLAMRALWGHPPGQDRLGELLGTPSGSIHVLDAMALVNSTLCSSIKRPGSRDGQGSDEMHRRCAGHLRTILTLLEPTIIHSQGRRKNSRDATPRRSLLTIFDEVDWQDKDQNVAIVRLEDRKMIWVGLYHPTHHWDWLLRPYYVNIAEPALRRARDLAIELTSG